MSEVISTSATLKPSIIDTERFLINGSTGTNGQVIQTTGTGIQWGTLPASQWSGTSGQPITYTPFVGIGTSTTPTANLQVTGNVYISNTLCVNTLRFFDPKITGGSATLPAFLGNVPFSIDMVSLLMANYVLAGTHKPFGTQQVSIVDLTAASGGTNAKGYIGGFTDGRYGYFVPYNNGVYSGLVARVDLQNFATGGVTFLDLTVANPNAKGYLGGFTDGRYGYFVPSFNGLVTRVDLQNFTTSGVTTIDLTLLNGNAKGFEGGFTDGRYGYFVPYYTGAAYSGLIARVDLQNFTTGGVTFLDLTAASGGTNAKGYTGGFTDGRYGYFVPYYNGAAGSGLVARVDLQNFTTGGVTFLDLTAASGGTNAKGYLGGFTDGRYGYFVPYYTGAAYSGLIARVDLQNFTTSGVTFLDLTAASGGTNAKGYEGGFTDGRYGYLVPEYNGAYVGLVARVDLQNFTTSGVTFLDLTSVNANAKGYAGGFTDGRYGYFVPNNGVSTGLVARVQITIPPYFGESST